MISQNPPLPLFSLRRFASRAPGAPSLLVSLFFFLIGAEPTLPPAGGELAREIEVEVIDALSETKFTSRSARLIDDVTLACLERSLPTVGSGGMDAADEADSGAGSPT